jgi:MFS family permease
MWGMILGFFCTIWIWNIFLNFLPLYLTKAYHVKLSALGIYACIPWVGGIVGDVLGGYITKKLAEKGIMSPMDAKRALIAVCAVCAAIAVILVPFVHSLTFTITLLTLALALAGDVAPAPMVASVSAIQNFGGYFGGAFSPVIAGMIADSTGSYSLALQGERKHLTCVYCTSTGPATSMRRKPWGRSTRRSTICWPSLTSSSC